VLFIHTFVRLSIVLLFCTISSFDRLVTELLLLELLGTKIRV